MLVLVRMSRCRDDVEMSDVEIVMTESRASPGIEPGVRRLKVLHLSMYSTVPCQLWYVCSYIIFSVLVRIICGPLSWRDDRLTGHGTSEKAYSYYSYSYTASQIQHGSVRLYRTSVFFLQGLGEQKRTKYIINVHQSSVRHDIIHWYSTRTRT